MNIPLLDLNRQYTLIKNEIDKAINEVMESSNFILGPNVEAIEAEIADLIGVKHGIGVANGTDALLLALKACNIGQGDEVITTPFSFFATSEVISQVGAKPVFVDIDLDTYNIDTNKIEEKITQKTKAIIPVHIFGNPVDMNKIMDIANKYNLIVIEDACQAIGAEYNGIKIGAIGHIGCFSFFPTKNLGAYGDGGMIITNDDEIRDELIMLRSHGQKVKYYNEVLGYNSRLDELQAAILRVKLKYLDDWNEKRKNLAYRYNELLKEFPIKTPKEINDIKHVYHLYVLECEEREELKKYLMDNGVMTGVYYPVPLHLQKANKDLNYKEGDFPNTEYVSKRTLALPLFPEIKKEEQDYVVKIIKDFYDMKGEKNKMNAENLENLLKNNENAHQLKDKIENKTSIIAVIGLGYVGLPLAVEKAKAGYKVIGLDVQEKRVDMVNEGINYIGDVVDEDLRELSINKMIEATTDYSKISEVDCVMICVPTPLDKHQQPDTSYVEKSTKDITKYLKKGMLIVLESTTYPGTTEDIVKPILESTGLKCGEDFFLAFSPERVDPGNKYYNIKNTPKVVGGVTLICTELAAKLYEIVLQGSIHKVTSPAVAEMEKILENTFRNINIGIVNEMAILCEKMGLDIWEVIEAAKTKPYGYMAFYPGPGLGGHCIPIDPYYLTWKAREYNYHTKLIEVSGEINNYMPQYVAEKAMKILNKHEKSMKGSKILLIGAAYKKDIDDLRESPVLRIIEYIEKENGIIMYNDPYIPQFTHNDIEYKSLELKQELLQSVDIVIIVTDHTCYDYDFIVDNSKVTFDTRNATKDVQINRDKIYKL